jgi:xanthine dehydrogenase YagR molybdenum-binding subunit
MMPTQQGPSPFIGGPFIRIDGPKKVSGGAKYTSDHHFPGMLYAVPVCATIARGTIRRIVTDRASQMPGVKMVYTRENIGRFYRVAPGGPKVDEARPPFEDDTIRYYGQYVAMVVADTMEQATAAAMAVRVTYDSQAPNLVLTDMVADEKPKVDTERGDSASAFAKAPVQLDETYTTPPETHNPIELHATVAVYDGNAFTLYETSQAIQNQKMALSQMLGVPPEKVRVITEYLGSGFGGKLWPWSHSLLAAAASRNLRRPIKLVVDRGMMFHNVGHRTNTQQRMRLSATTDGRLTSVQHDYVYSTSRGDNSKENCGEATGYLYSSPNLRAAAGFARRDIAPNTSMRGPGAVPGLYALESAMDELAIKLRMDPVALRLLNEPAIDESLNVPFSTRHLKECLSIGADRFGWSRRNPQVGAMRQDGKVLGWGMASCSWIARRLAAEVSVNLNADGSARVSCGTQDIGTGTYTIMAQMVAEVTGLPLDKIEVVLGDTILPPGPLSGGSMATGSLVPAVMQASREAIQHLLESASQAEGSAFSGQPADSLAFAQGRVYRKDQDPSSGTPFGKLLQSARLSHVSGSGKSGTSQSDPASAKHSMHSYGAHFVEVTWEPDTARLRVSRVVTVIDGGKIINQRTGRNQIEGAVVMGVGMALFEETHYDTRNGAPINNNLADYVMTTHADAPAIDVVFLDLPDMALNELGARGIGEIGLAGFAAAVTAAVYHATGVRVRDLPVKIEDLLTSQVTV